MFRRSSAGAAEGEARDSVAAQTAEAPAKSKPPAQTGKGRPTPKRSQAEAGRYRTITGSTTSGRGQAGAPASGKRTPEEKARDRSEWNKKQQAMRRGEEWALSPRDRGPLKKLARDYVDAHRRPSEYYMYALILLIVALLFGRSSAVISNYMQLFLLAIIVIIVADAVLLRRSIQKVARQRFPGEPTRGLTYYAIMRALQLRRFRTPAPRLKPGDDF